MRRGRKGVEGREADKMDGWMDGWGWYASLHEVDGLEDFSGSWAHFVTVGVSPNTSADFDMKF